MKSSDLEFEIVPIGTVMPVMANADIPEGWEPLQGGLFYKDQYFELWDAIYHADQSVKDMWEAWGGKIRSKYLSFPDISSSTAQQLTWGSVIKDIPGVKIMIKAKRIENSNDTESND
jgi:hypothetical protein